MNTLNNLESAGNIRNKINENFSIASSTINPASAVSAEISINSSTTVETFSASVQKVLPLTNQIALSTFAQQNFFQISGGLLNSLTVQGSATINSSLSGEPTLYVGLEKVGINTNNPTEALTINGNALLPNAIYTNSIRVGNCTPVSEGITGKLNGFVKLLTLSGFRFVPIYESIH
jgi:hypothetical protein